MSYPNQHVHEDIQVKDGFKKIILDDLVYFFHSESLSIVSTGQKEHELSVSSQELRDFESQIMDTSAGKAPEFPIDIKALALNVAEQCNLRCVYCYAGDGDYGKGDKMSQTVAKKALDKFVPGQTHFTVVFFGGEPLLNFSVVKEVIEYNKKNYKSTKFSYRMTTNGLLLTSSILEYLKNENVHLTISYDGKTAQKQQRLDMNRKQNERDFVDERLKKFRSDLEKLQGFKIRSTVTADMIAAFEHDLKEFRDEYPFKLGFNRVATNDEKFKYSIDDAKKLMDCLESVVNHLLDQKEYEKILSLDNLGGHMNMIFNRQYLSMTCGAGLNYLSVATDGTLYLCHRFTEDKEEAVGSVDKGLDLESLKAIQEHRKVLHEPCNGCWMRSICRGGCFHENKMEHQTKHKPDPIFATCRTEP